MQNPTFIYENTKNRRFLTDAQHRKLFQATISLPIAVTKDKVKPRKYSARTVTHQHSQPALALTQMRNRPVLASGRQFPHIRLTLDAI